MAEKNHSAPRELREPSVSPENARFTTIDYKGTYGMIMRDPKNGDFAVILPDGKTAKVSAREALVSTPPFGSEKTPVGIISPEGARFEAGHESRPRNLAELFQVAREKVQTSLKTGQTAEYADLVLLSPNGISVTRTGIGQYVIVSEHSKESLRFAFEKGKEAIGAASLFRTIGKAVIASETCQKKAALFADCKVYSDRDAYGHKDLRIDDSPMLSDSFLASSEELAEHVRGRPRNLADVIARFVNATVDARAGKVPVKVEK
jgi:hypothetical protein